MQTDALTALKSENVIVKQIPSISGRQDLLTAYGLSSFYEKYALPYVVPTTSSDKKVSEIPNLYDKYLSNITGQVKYESNTLLRSLVFSEPKNKFENLPTLSRQAIANAFRLKPGPIDGIDTELLTWPKKHIKPSKVEEPQPRVLKRNQIHEKDCVSDYLYDDMRISKKQRVGLESTTVLVD
ncbi:hypothetical protein BB561_003197 [Smittium simulii]|uniref:Mediator complex subunit 19 n=1 Tax=Smittium simulii TaxID=133385 RepID=A0A2T9YMK0_9FUNG|nr:hypothetical protein BB561_003197 [Smittium simulii]